jgi:hypothetical protein
MIVAEWQHTQTISFAAQIDAIVVLPIQKDFEKL